MGVALKSLVYFESPRLMIQEVAQIVVESDHYVEEFFSRSIDLFKDDSNFMT